MAESWLQGNDDVRTFSELNQYLDTETSSFLQKIFEIASENGTIVQKCRSTEQPMEGTQSSSIRYSEEVRKDRDSFEHLLKDVTKKTKHFNEKFEKLDTITESISKKLKSQQQKLKDQEKLIETLTKNQSAADTKYKSKFDDINTELNSASHFMQSMTELFTEKVNACEDRCTFRMNEKLKYIELDKKKQEETEKIIASSIQDIKKELKTQSKSFNDFLEKYEHLSNKIRTIEESLMAIPSKVDTLEKNATDVQSIIAMYVAETSNQAETLQKLHENITDLDKVCSELKSSNLKQSRSNIGAAASNSDQNIYFYGDHETNVSESKEVDLQKFSTICKKNSSHSEFIPVKSFTLQHLPVGHRDKDLFRLIKITADLTVMVEVETVSDCRPEYWPNTNVPYPFYDMKGKKCRRTGSGRVFEVDENFDDKGDCLIYGDKWVFLIETASHLVFDQSEADSVSVKISIHKWPFTVDSKHIQVTKVDVEKDVCRLYCFTDNEYIGEQLREILKYFNDIRWRVDMKYFHSRDVDKLSFIVSHPHGCSKHITIGQWVDTYQLDDCVSKFTYTTATCPGSAGAPVQCLGYDGHRLIHSGCLKSGLNYSSMG